METCQLHSHKGGHIGTHTFRNPREARSVGGKSTIEDVIHGDVLIPGYNAYRLFVGESGK